MIIIKLIRPRKNCKICHGLGLQYFADWFDREFNLHSKTIDMIQDLVNKNWIVLTHKT